MLIRIPEMDTEAWLQAMATGWLATLMHPKAQLEATVNPCAVAHATHSLHKNLLVICTCDGSQRATGDAVSTEFIA